ncbi:DUF4265 domain-containing protein [uncultured Jatrophihabitans sp.]|uniref:DUF4265 domain-containing protein n=1 Tax=uncultured Jatrophihabitans sp. TaxID=1610747 RepID=UPI0035CB61B1
MENVYRGHPSPTGQMRDGELIPVSDAAEADTVVWFALPPDGEQAIWEGLSAQSAGQDQVIVRSVPLFAYGLGYGDRVSVIASAEGPLVATAIVERGDHYGFRVWLKNASASLADIVRTYGNMGCFIEGYSNQLVGLSCPSVLAQQVANALATDERAGRLLYETAR